MTTLEFAISFHGPFRVGAGAAVPGLDAPVDRSRLLPASSLKGLLRAEATERLRLPAPLVDAVFGSRTTPCPWWWSDARITNPHITPSTKIKVDERGRAERGFLRFGEQVWADGGTFTVEQRLPLPEAEAARHMNILVASALSVSSLGSSRRRGEGWVSITCGIDVDVKGLVTA